MLHVPFKVFTATVSLIDPNRGIYASALRTLPNAPSPIVPSSRTFSRLISQLSSYGISLPYRYSDKKNPIDTKLNAFDVSSKCVHNAEGSKDSHRRVNLMNFHHHFIQALAISTYNIR